MIRTVTAFLLVSGALALPASVAASGNETDGQASWNFQVYLDDKEIGSHRFEREALPRGSLVRSSADFQVKVLFFTAFSYEHDNAEIWRDGCLESIDARTRTNDKVSEVLGQLEDRGFVLQTPEGDGPVADCVATFAYWDRDLLNRDRLLNSQTGEYLDVDVQSLPDDTVEIADRRILTERLRLEARGVDIVISYDRETGAWVALDSTLKNGRTLRYRRSAADLPAFEDAARLAASDEGEPRS